MMSDSEEIEYGEIEHLEDEESDECLEFEIGLMVRPETQEISLITDNGNKLQQNFSIAPIQNGLKTKLDSRRHYSSRTTNSPYPSTSNIQSINVTKAIATNDTLDTATILGAIENLRVLMTQVAAKTDRLYQEFQEIKNKNNNLQDGSLIDRTNLGIPLGTKEELLAFDEKIKNDELPRTLFKKFLLKVDDRSWDRYVSSCLFACFKKELAVLCSFYGKNNNIEIQNFEMIKLLRECTEKKFSNLRTTDINQAIKKWFHLATDRYRRIIIKEK